MIYVIGLIPRVTLIVGGYSIYSAGALCLRYLNRTAKQPQLTTDPTFIEFLQLDDELPKSTSTSALSGAGMLRLFGKVGDSISKMTFKMDETDQVSDTRWRFLGVFTCRFVAVTNMLVSMFAVGVCSEFPFAISFYQRR